MIKYIGSKRLLLPRILDAVRAAAPPGAAVADLFSGTARVGHALKAAGYRVLANDHNAYAHALATCYVQADAERWAEAARRILEDLSRLPGRAGWFTETYCVRSRYFHPANGERIEAMRDAIAALSPEPELEAVLLASLLEAADRVDSTAGLQMAYMKRWAARALKPIALRPPALLPRPAAGACAAFHGDAEAVAGELECDVAYLDPPYNQHSYLRNYHVWETLVAWDAPQHYGVACKRADCRDPQTRSPFNSRPAFRDALARVVADVRARLLVLSYNDEAWVSLEELVELCSARGDVRVLAFDSKRYVGAQIGIHNPAGDKVGKIGRLRNLEYLLVTGERADVARATDRRLAVPA